MSLDVLDGVRVGVRRARWWWSGVTGADAYDRYVAHLARVHPGQAPPSPRQFWRDKYAEQEERPGSRCC